MTAAPFLERVERVAVDVAVAIDTARRAAESATLRTLGEMVGEFSAAPATMAGEGAVAQPTGTAFPNSWILAGRQARWFRVAWPALSTVLLFVFTTAMFAGRFVP